MNIHMLKCYKDNIDQKTDVTTAENAYFMDGSLLCQFVKLEYFFSKEFLFDLSAYNTSASYRKCLNSIFARDQICSFDRYPYSYQYSKIFWKLVMSSCAVENSKLKDFQLK
jgi:hypothetical protein